MLGEGPEQMEVNVNSRDTRHFERKFDDAEVIFRKEH